MFGIGQPNCDTTSYYKASIPIIKMYIEGNTIGVGTRYMFIILLHFVDKKGHRIDV